MNKESTYCNIYLLIFLRSRHFAQQRVLGDIYKMAEEAADHDDPLLDTHRTSLLEVIEDRNRALNKVVHNIGSLSISVS